MAAEAPRGVLYKQRLDAKLSLEHVAPGEQLAPYVVRYWVAQWALPDGETREQRVIPHPCANLEIEAGGARVYGVKSHTTVATARGEGRIVGVKLAPGALRAFWSRPAAELTDRKIAVREVFSAAASEWVAAAALPLAQMAARLDALIARDVPAQVDDRLREVQRIHDEVAADHAILQVEALAARHRRSVRSLQALFREYVGVSPKWLIMRYRMHEAAARIERERELPLARLARELGYFDQAHFTRNFTQVVGVPPAKYARDA